MENRRPVAAVTGGTGFVGLHVVDALVQRGWHVRVLVRKAASLPLGCEPILGDLADASALRRLVNGASVVVHLAAQLRGRDPQAFRAVNRDGTAILARTTREAAPDARFLLVSSIAARVPELSDYAATKRAGEEVAIATLDGRTPWVVLRPGLVYGPGDRDGLVYLRLVTAPVTPVPGPPLSRLAMIHARDFAMAVVALAPEGPQGTTFELCDGTVEGHAWPDFLAGVAAAAGTRPPRFVRVPDAAFLASGHLSDAWSRVAGHAPFWTRGKARELLYRDWSSSLSAQPPDAFWRPEIELAAGLASTAAWWRTLPGARSRHADPDRNR